MFLHDNVNADAAFRQLVIDARTSRTRLDLTKPLSVAHASCRMAGIKRPSSQLEPELQVPSLPSEPMDGAWNREIAPPLAGSVQKKFKMGNSHLGVPSAFGPSSQNAMHSVLDPHAPSLRPSQVFAHRPHRLIMYL